MMSRPDDPVHRSLPWQGAARGAHLLDPSGAVRPTVFEELTGLAQVHDAINLGQGFPDTDGPEELRRIAADAVVRDLSDGGLNQYAPGAGLPSLRQAVADHQHRWYGQRLDPAHNVLVTTGATEGIAASLLAVVSAGDRVVTFSPYYDSYAAMLGLVGAEHASIPLRWPDFQPTPEDIAAAITPETRAVLLNTPHNPTGTVFSRETLQQIVDAAAAADAIIISDEVYEHLVFEAEHVPVASVPGAAERTLTLGSAGKSFSLTGWKVGWVTGPAELITGVRAVKQFMSYSSGGPFQAAIATGLGYDDDYFRAGATRLAAGRDILADALRGVGLAVNRPAAGYFLIADAAPLGVHDARELAYRMTSDLGVAAIPVSAFVDPQEVSEYRSQLRFAFCKRPDVLAAAAARLADLPDVCASLSSAQERA
ncbi:aminotransferase class I/II-fold pyridoxal phosphate-dependent enzyme [Zhihengliuella flava]|uniref:N-succinyldiaminopimelate aminotransferase n=1 Tax=Zhihengliuella flava TaxID=1285193 RepID=A0A931D6X5_9MICC|nr:aminotransferase class I/II-fold pyridoxal phosphate-dependent enzyme [Zhihengliuella flava]MBG6083529.1 N-succinyldiaminopimelate aminotransferase [Zhihengliuella flava]